MANPLPPAPAPSTPGSTGETPSDYFERNIRTVELANAVARFLGLNPADEIPFEELTRRLAAAPPLSAARPSGLCPTCGDALRENEFLRERCADYETLKRAVNHSANCLPECADNPNGCVEACPRFNTARWLTDQQAEIERLRAALDAARADTTDAERWRYIRTILVEDHWPLTGHTTISALTYKIQSLPHHATVEEVVDA
ncbi:MAG TPA: hypothetical protein VN085_07235, partial [Vicinamibacterales bacterium]|nr:hypothetical protein [Vicinamibacterales bacterium]